LVYSGLRSTEMGVTDSMVRFGPAGWCYPDWKQPLYEGRSGDGLELLSTVFDTVEVNSTFYRAPTPALAAGWLRKVADNPDFQFTAKLWQVFTHRRDVERQDVALFRRGIAPLIEAGRLGALLMQFPWSFRYTDTSWQHVVRLHAAFPDVPVVIEVRHSSWDVARVRDEMRARGLGLVNIDQPDLPGNLGPSSHVTAAVGYVRLHGRNRDAWFRDDAGRDERYHYAYDRTELRSWADRLQKVAAQARRVFVITNNHFRGNAVADALELRHLYDGVSLSVPSGWVSSFPRLEQFCRPRGPIQGELF